MKDKTATPMKDKTATPMKGKTATIRIPVNLHRTIKMLTANAGQKLAAWVEARLREAVRHTK